MDFLLKIFKRNIFLLNLLLLPSFVFTSENISIKASIIFNTACAKCHEGQCSGRTSFYLPEDTANQHLLRHGGERSQEYISQLSMMNLTLQTKTLSIKKSISRD